MAKHVEEKFILLYKMGNSSIPKALEEKNFKYTLDRLYITAWHGGKHL